MRALLTTALSVTAVAMISAQAPAPTRSDTMHLTVNTSISDAAVSPGEKVTVSFDITPKRGMHVYAPGKHDYQVIAVKIDPQPWLKVAPTTYPPSEIYDFKELNEKVETYGKPFTLVQDLTVLNTAAARKALAAAPVKLTGRLEYQACDDKVCYAPTKVPVSFNLTVK
jgi:DsbC/DsbD-like thiol-disulfide interchange protein